MSEAHANATVAIHLMAKLPFGRTPRAEDDACAANAGYGAKFRHDSIAPTLCGPSVRMLAFWTRPAK
jgi:hypothetical protein